jgi:ectoine hydroxylase-related dioxygenase (phytanoyl-CoA dioxygenase family)
VYGPDRDGELDEEGFVVVHELLTFDECDAAVTALPESPRRRGGVRNLIEEPVVRALLTLPAVLAIAGTRFATKATLFDKTPDANWKVPWHQDRAIAVRERFDAPGFGPWTMKSGVLHVEPPAAVLESMLAIRIHLDDCGETNGPLRVVPRSHRNGKLSASEIAEIVARGRVVTLPMKKGAAIIMRPLLVHASSPAKSPGHRRVLHLEFN